jgi:GT2 family glycosyltransferase
VIVTWNAAEVIGECLRSVFDADMPSTETIVVDNDSSDGTVELVNRHFPKAVTIETGSNLGFAPAANLGIQRARGSAILLLNPDAQMHPGALRQLTAVLESNPRAGAAGPRPTEASGAVHEHAEKRLPSPASAFAQQIGMRGLMERLSRGDGPASSLEESPAQVPCLTGAALLVPRAVFERLGYLDETLPMYLEDLDLCARIRAAGLELIYVPGATVLHDAGHSSARSPGRDLLFQMEIGQAPWMYLRRYRGKGPAHAYAAALALGAACRMMVLTPLLVLARLSGRTHDRLTTLNHRASILFRWAVGSKIRFRSRVRAAFPERP